MTNIYTSPHLQRNLYSVSLAEQKEILSQLESRTDPEAQRLKRYLALADLTRQEGSPVQATIARIIALPTLQGFDLIETPEVISPKVVFDIFNFPPDHPARQSTDSYYVDSEHILRPHTSLMWKYYLDLPEVRAKLAENGSVGALSYGKTYRCDEIDWEHSNVFHQIDGLFMARKDLFSIDQAELERVLVEIAESLYGQGITYRFHVDHFPYTDPSLEMEIAWEDKWVEILGGGIVHPQVIRNLGLDPAVYGAWAVGFGADRLAMLKVHLPDIRLLYSEDERIVRQLRNIDQDYQPVSKYPPVPRDISFVVSAKDFNLNHYYQAAQWRFGDLATRDDHILQQYLGFHRVLQWHVTS